MCYFSVHPCTILKFSPEGEGVDSCNNVVTKFNFIKVISKTILKVEQKSLFIYPVEYSSKQYWLISLDNGLIIINKTNNEGIENAN